MKNLMTLSVFFFLFADSGSISADSHLESVSGGKNLIDFKFWQTTSGWWEGSNTYFDSDMDYTIRDYSSLVHIELDGKLYRETEHRFYPDGISAERYGQNKMNPGEGVELVVVYTGELLDDSGTLGKTVADHAGPSSGSGVAYTLLSDVDAVRTNRYKDTEFDSYRMYFTFTSPDHRYRSNFGLHYDSDDHESGSLRAFILYRDRRIEESDFEKRRKALRKKYNVKVISTSDPQKKRRSLVRRLD